MVRPLGENHLEGLFICRQSVLKCPQGNCPLHKKSNDNWLFPSRLCSTLSSTSSSSLSSWSSSCSSPSSSSSPSCYEGSFQGWWEDITRLVANSPKLLRHPLIWIILLRALLSSRENIFSDFEKCSGRKIKLNEPAKFQAVQKTIFSKMMMISISRQDGTRSTGKASSTVQTCFCKITMRMSVKISKYHVRLFYFFYCWLNLDKFGLPSV